MEMLDIQKICDRLNKLRAVYSSMYGGEWLVNHAAPSVFTSLCEFNIHVGSKEIEHNTDEQLKQLINRRTCMVLKTILEELEEEYKCLIK